MSQVLLDRAMANGVQVESRARSSDPLEPAEITLDCTGRSGVLARAKNVRRYHHGPRPVALIAEWTLQAPWPVPDDRTCSSSRMTTADVVGAGRAGVRRRVGGPAAIHLARGGSSKDVICRARARMFRQLIAGALPACGVGCPPYHATQYAGDAAVAGDAAAHRSVVSRRQEASTDGSQITAHTCLRNRDGRARTRILRCEGEGDRTASSKSCRFTTAQGHRHAFWNERSAMRNVNRKIFTMFSALTR
jgi:hypothetical protein